MGKWQKQVTAVGVVYAICLGNLLRSRAYPEAPLVIILFHVPIFLGLLKVSALKFVKRSHFYKTTALSTIIMSMVILIIWLIWMNADGWAGQHQWNDATKIE